MPIPVRLKNKWAKATVTAAGFPVASEASIAVTVVPMLAPSVNGNTCSNVRIPAPIRGMISDVVIELLCTNTVITTPKAMATSGAPNR